MPKRKNKMVEITPEFLKEYEDLKRSFRESDRRYDATIKMAHETLGKLQLLRKLRSL